MGSFMVADISVQVLGVLVSHCVTPCVRVGGDGGGSAASAF